MRQNTDFFIKNKQIWQLIFSVFGQSDQSTKNEKWNESDIYFLDQGNHAMHSYGWCWISYWSFKTQNLIFMEAKKLNFNIVEFVVYWVKFSLLWSKSIGPKMTVPNDIWKWFSWSEKYAAHKVSLVANLEDFIWPPYKTRTLYGLGNFYVFNSLLGCLFYVGQAKDLWINWHCSLIWEIRLGD